MGFGPANCAAVRSRTRPGHGRNRARARTCFRYSIAELCRNALQSQRIMIILDNCEHVVDAAAQLVATMLRVAQRRG